MITDTDALNTIDFGKYYAILPSVSFTYSEDEYLTHHKAQKYHSVLNIIQEQMLSGNRLKAYEN